MSKKGSIFIIFAQILSLFAPLSGMTAPNKVPTETKGERTIRMQKDREVLKSLVDAGSNLKKSHVIEFHFVGYEKAKITAVAEEGKKMGYRVSKIDSLNDEKNWKYWYFDLIQSVIPSEKSIFSHTEALTLLAKKHAVEFDGWGCLIVK